MEDILNDDLVSLALGLRACDAMSGTDIAHGAICQRGARYWPSVSAYAVATPSAVLTQRMVGVRSRPRRPGCRRTARRR
eukprot:2471079-Rhodomonas_salina.1